MRRVNSVVVDRVFGNGGKPVKPDRFTGIRIDIETGEVTAGNIQTNAMALFEQVAGGIETDFQLIHFSGFHQLALITIIAVSGAQDTIGQVQGITLWIIRVRRIDIDQLGGKVAVRRR